MAELCTSDRAVHIDRCMIATSLSQETAGAANKTSPHQGAAHNKRFTRQRLTS